MSFCLAEFLSCWLVDHELFLYAKGTSPDDVHLWRCKKPANSSSSSSLVVPMNKSDDFDYVSNVKNHRQLIGGINIGWDETDYKRLVKYVYENRLLVNGQGFVIAELHKTDKDGNKSIDDANEDVPAIYIRSLDVLPLKDYIPNLTVRPIPLRTVKYLGDANGKAALMEEKNSDVTNKLTARVDDLESKNKTLDTNVTKLTACQVGMIDTIDNLKSKNKTMEGKITNLTEDLVTQMNALATLQQEVKNIKGNTKEPWMNDFTNNEWVGIGGLVKGEGPYDDLTIIESQGTFTTDESSTNVRARYWYKGKLYSNHINKYAYKLIFLEDLTHKELARFTRSNWFYFISKGKPCVSYRSYC